MIIEKIKIEELNPAKYNPRKDLKAGDWDLPKLADLISSLDADMFDISLTGFDMAEVDDLFSKVHDKEIEEDDFDLDAALEDGEKPISKAGDIWLLGKHRLICGDSTKEETYERLMDGKKANLCVIDPPYNVNYTAGSENERTIKNDNMKDTNFYEFLLAAFKNIFNSLDDGAEAYVFHADTEGLNFRSAFKDAGFYLSGVCIWAKQSLVLGRSDYHWQHEPVLGGTRGQEMN